MREEDRGWRALAANLPERDGFDKMDCREYAENHSHGHGGGKLGIVVVVRIAGRDGHIAIRARRCLHAVSVVVVAAVVVPFIAAK